MTPGEEVRALRELLGENTAAFGRRWQKSGRTVENWEQGRRFPDAYLLNEMRRLAARTRTRKKKTA